MLYLNSSHCKTMGSPADFSKKTTTKIDVSLNGTIQVVFIYHLLCGHKYSNICQSFKTITSYIINSFSHKPHC